MPNLISIILNSKSIAIVGASRNPKKLGNQIMQNLIRDGFKGQIIPVNPHAKTILNTTAYKDLHSYPKNIDLLIICTPAHTVSSIIDQANQKGVAAAIIITAGFSESSQTGTKLETQLHNSIIQGKCRVIGPNCLGLLSTHHNLNASFGPKLPKKGNTMLITQSGALVTAVMDWASHHNLGMSSAFTMGNRADLSENEILKYAATDGHTDQIMIYLESFKNASTFFEIAAKITPHKPIFLLKGGTSKQGQKASLSHTAALATDQKLVTSLCHQSGVILLDDIQQWMSAAHFFSTTNKNNKPQDLFIITNAGGPGVVSSDISSQIDLKLSRIDNKQAHVLNHQLGLNHSSNPLDIIGDATPEDFSRALNSAFKLKHRNLLILVTPQTSTQPDKLAKVIVDFKNHKNADIVVVFLGGSQMQKAQEHLQSKNIPTFTYPNNALKLLKLKQDYQSHKQKGLSLTHSKTNNNNQYPVFNTSKPIQLNTALNLLNYYDFKLPSYRIISHLNQIPSTLKYTHTPAYMKTTSMHLAHKAKHGGVLPDIFTQSPTVAFRKLQQLSPQVIVQKTLAYQAEIIISARRDVNMGTFIVFGTGGANTDDWNDREYIFLPSSRDYLNRVFNQSSIVKRLKKHNINPNPIKQDLTKLIKLITQNPRISEIEINPLVITEASKTYALDIKLKLNPRS